MGIDVKHELFIAILKSIQWVFINLWYWGVLIGVILGIKIYLAKRYKVTRADDLGCFIISLIKGGKNPPILYLTKDTFPKDFTWLTPAEFVFGKFGSISFRDGNNDNRDAFQLLTEAKGGEVRVQKTANLLNISGNQTRVTMNNLSQRLHKNSKLAPFIDVITTNDGGYKLAIKTEILKH